MHCIMQYIKILASSLMLTVFAAGPALASLNATALNEDVSVSAGPVTTVFTGIAAGLAVIWGVRKVISLLNKS